MPEIKSGLGNMTFTSTDQKLFTIPDESTESVENVQPQNEQRQISPEEYNQYRAKLAQQAKKNQMGASKSRIEMLTGITRGLREVSVGEQVFTLRTLKGKEMKHVLAEATMAANSASSIVTVYELRLLTLAYSLYSIDDVDINILLDVQALSDEERLQVKIGYLEEFDETLLQILHKNYEALTKENNEKFGIKNADDAKEVSKEMKKSSTGA